MSLADHAPDRTDSPVSAKKLALAAVFIALSVVGSLVKIPSPLGTVALDAAPGFFAALALGGGLGAVVIAIGHLASAALAGFPLTLPLHLAIAAGMAVCAVVFRILGRRGTLGLVLGTVTAILLNSVALGLVVLPVGGWAMYVVSLPSLFIGAVVNVVLAALAWRALRDTKLLK